MTDKSKTLHFQAVRLTACSLLLTAWLPLSYAGPGHDHNSDGGHDHGQENAPATEAFYPDQDNTAQTAPPTGKEDAQNDEHDHEHEGDGNADHTH